MFYNITDNNLRLSEMSSCLEKNLNIIKEPHKPKREGYTSQPIITDL